MDRIGLKMKYKADTGQSSVAYCLFARVGRYGDIIVDSDPELQKEVESTGTLEIQSSDYVKWLEETLMNLL